MKAYQQLVQHVLDNGTRKENRTGVDTISTFNYNYEVDLRDGFPLLTTKNVSWKNIVVEMLWFLSGQTDISILKRHGCKFWDAWADETGKVPSAYGAFWRHFPVHQSLDPKSPKAQSLGFTEEPGFNDQIAWVLDELKRNPMSRRLVVSAWAPGNAQTSKLPPCHSIFMMNVQNEEESLDSRLARAMHTLKADPQAIPEGIRNRIVEWHKDTAEGRRLLSLALTQGGVTPKVKQRLCLHLTQRSCDVALGIPYNIASYALLLHLFSRFSGIEPGIFAHTLVDAHIYTAKPDSSMAEYDHIPGLKDQITREPRRLPKLLISDAIKDLKDVEALMDPSVTTDEVMRHFVLEGYDPHPTIPFKVAV